MQKGSPSHPETDEDATHEGFSFDLEHENPITIGIRESKSSVRFTELKAFGD